MACTGLEIKEGETKPPKRYNAGSMILAMENAGQLIEEEELREQIRGSGIGTSATRAEILKKLFSNRYLSLNKKTQIITPTLMGEMIYDTVDCSIRSLLNPKLTASWELGLTRVSEGTVTEEEYLEKLNGFVSRNTNNVKNSNFSSTLQQMYMRDSQFYKKPYGPAAGGRKKTGRKGKQYAD
jgi:DNA topoisomerase-3